MNPLRLLPLWRPRSTLVTPSAFRVEVCPPSLRHAPAGLGQRLLFWLLAPAPQEAAPPINRLPGVKRDFAACVADLPAAGAEALRHAIDDARSLRELWHLRAEVYKHVGRAHSEAEADRRLQRLNTHFPTRAPRAGMPGRSGAPGARRLLGADAPVTLMTLH
jgi:hypothetical protein